VLALALSPLPNAAPNRTLQRSWSQPISTWTRRKISTTSLKDRTTWLRRSWRMLVRRVMPPLPGGAMLHVGILCYHATRRGRRARNDDRAQGRAVQSAVTGQSDSAQSNRLAREFSKFKNEVGAHVQLLEAAAKRSRTSTSVCRATWRICVASSTKTAPAVDEMQDKWTIANDTWTWKQFRGTAESVYRLMRVPFDNRAFVTMCARGSPDLDRAQPLAWRYKVITQETMFRPYWAQVMNYITKKQATIDVMGEVILGELVALFIVSCRPTDYVTYHVS
jgi:hypothetical protein